MKHQQWLLGVCLLLFIALLAGAALLYNTLSEQTDAGNLMPAVTTTAANSSDPAATTAANTETTATQEFVPAPDFTVTDRDGNAVRLSDFRGKPVILNFWASWCGPCKSEMPDFEEAYRAYGEEITFVMINATDGSRETVETACAFIDAQGYTFPIYFDTTMEASINYGASSIPLTIFVDAEGNLVAYGSGALNAATLQKGIDMILPK